MDLIESYFEFLRQFAWILEFPLAFAEDARFLHERPEFRVAFSNLFHELF